MQINEYQADSNLQIKAYQPGSITVGNQCYQQSIVISPSSVHTVTPRTIAELTAKDLAFLIDLHPEVVILGTGNQQHFPAPELLADLIDHQIGTEIMDTSAACRTFNVLLAESRNVVAYLLIDSI